MCGRILGLSQIFWQGSFQSESNKRLLRWATPRYPRPACGSPLPRNHHLYRRQLCLGDPAPDPVGAGHPGSYPQPHPPSAPDLGRLHGFIPPRMGATVEAVWVLDPDTDTQKQASCRFAWSQRARNDGAPGTKKPASENRLFCILAERASADTWFQTIRIDP